MENFPYSATKIKDLPLGMLWDLRVMVDLEILHRIWPALAIAAIMAVIILWYRET